MLSDTKKLNDSIRDEARNIVLRSPLGKVRVKRTAASCSLPFGCPTYSEAPAGCMDCVADHIVSLLSTALKE